MNVDNAISEVNTNIRPNPDKFSPLYREVVITLADEVKRLRGILQDVLDNDRFAALENANNLDDELKAQIIEAIGKKKEGDNERG